MPTAFDICFTFDIRLRRERDLTQKQLADKLADYYGVSVDYLLGRTNVKKPYPSQ